MWKIKPFNELTTKQLFEIYYLRGNVFVTEQQRALNDVDLNDLKAIHIMNLLDHRLVCYARVFLDDDHVTFGRVVIAPEYRGKGFGNDLLAQIMTTIKRYFPGNKIVIEAQVQVAGFYQTVGFQTVGEPFIHAFTPHIKMVHNAL